MELPTAVTEEIDGTIEHEMKSQRIPGLSLAIVRQGRPLMAKGYGVANLELQPRAHAGTVYQVGSLTKQFTAAAVLLLARDGKLAIDDPVGRYLCPLPRAWSPITLRHLLTHTSGIPEVTTLPGFTYRDEYQRADLLGMLAAAPLDFSPGRQWTYSNSGYVLLGWIVEEAGGISLERFLAERVFGPLEMAATRFIHFQEVVRDCADGYEPGDDGWRRCIPLRPEAIAGAGGILSTVRDLARWDAALYTDFPLDRSSRQAMATPAKLDDGSIALTGEPCGEHYGFGWYLGRHHGRPIASHTGETDAGFSSMILRLVESGWTILLLSNVKAIGQLRITWSIADLL